jgi:serine protease inhibitor
MNKAVNTAILLALFSLVITTSCDKSTEIFEEKSLDFSAQEKEIAKASNEFTLNAYGFLTNELKPNQNLFYSGVSISSVLSMTANGAAGDTYEQMYKALNFDKFSEEQINNYQYKMLTTLPFISNSTKLNIAYGIWHTPDLNVLPTFKNTVTEDYKSRIAALDYNNADETLKDINGFIDRKTEQMIPEFFQNLPVGMKMLLVNAIYFKGDWDKKFDKEKTKKDNFRLQTGNTVQTEFMEVTHSFEMATTNSFQAVKLPYKDKKFEMIIVKPSNNSTLNTLKEKFTKYETVQEMDKEFRDASLILSIPKFKFEYEIDLQRMLEQFGMVDAFKSEADFSRMAALPLKIDKVKQKAVIDVNEAGSEAAAVTVVSMTFSSAGPSAPTRIKYDEPFIFMLREASSGLILFMGQYNLPE